MEGHAQALNWTHQVTAHNPFFMKQSNSGYVREFALEEEGETRGSHWAVRAGVGGGLLIMEYVMVMLSNMNVRVVLY